MNSDNQNLVYPKLTDYFTNTQFFEEGCFRTIKKNCEVYKDFNECILCKPYNLSKNGKCYTYSKE